MDEPIIVAIDIGTSKICALAAREEGGRGLASDPDGDGLRLRILGVGIEPSQGIRKGVVVDMLAASQAVVRSVEKAERSCGLEIESALVSLAGSHVSSVNRRGVVGVAGRTIEREDSAGDV